MSKLNSSQQPARNFWSYSPHWLSLCFCLYGLIVLYLNSLNLWILCAFSLVTSFNSVIFGRNYIVNIFNLNFAPNFVRITAVRIFQIIYYVSSVFGFIKFLQHLPINDKSIFLLPIFAILLIFGGSALSLFSEK